MSYANENFRIHINTENDAFVDNPEYEVVRLLDVVKKRLIDGEDFGLCFDLNGNRVGWWRLNK